MILRSVLDRLEEAPAGFPKEIGFLMEQDAERIGWEMVRRFHPMPYRGLGEVLKFQASEVEDGELFTEEITDLANLYERKNEERREYIASYITRRSAAFAHTFISFRITRVRL